ncbi:unnamed protein product [Pseudo-nitzschia multistriata]|uniref:Peptidyl-prolyl cis-trans isomerase n=1 Tax=Pseudo-nitzschia multistriata TaxID=183589 RepID=A0A448YW96_9STRA|nr:unnamed protein product [Pseudo-nitzschia multistriata]
MIFRSVLPTSLWRLAAMVALLVVAAPNGRDSVADGFIVGAFKKVEKDFLSLTRRVTARHILVPDEDVARVLKQKIRDECVDKELWVIDAFEVAARKYSRDETTNFRGGLLGELVPQGYCRSPELDRLQFSVSLGEIVGPVETEYGYHLLLVSERTNCPKLDGDKTRMMQTRGDDVFGTLVEGKQVGKVDMPELLMDQVKFWSLTLIAGGLVAELAEKLVSNL